jgi:hypothetical protein
MKALRAEDRAPNVIALENVCGALTSHGGKDFAAIGEAFIVEDEPQWVPWHSAAETRRLLEMMSPLNRKKVEQGKLLGRRIVGGVYKRTRPNEDGKRSQRAEVQSAFPARVFELAIRCERSDYQNLDSERREDGLT